MLVWFLAKSKKNRRAVFNRCCLSLRAGTEAECELSTGRVNRWIERNRHHLPIIKREAIRNPHVIYPSPLSNPRWGKGRHLQPPCDLKGGFKDSRKCPLLPEEIRKILQSSRHRLFLFEILRGDLFLAPRRAHNVAARLPTKHRSLCKAANALLVVFEARSRLHPKRRKQLPRFRRRVTNKTQNKMAVRRRAGSARKMMAFSRIVNCHTEEEYEKVFKKAGDALVLVEFVAVSERGSTSPMRPPRFVFFVVVRTWLSAIFWQRTSFSQSSRSNSSTLHPPPTETMRETTLTSSSLSPPPPNVSFGGRVGARRARACSLT